MNFSFRESIVAKVLKLITPRERFILYSVFLFQVVMSFLELISVSLIAALGLILMTNSTDNRSLNFVGKLLEFFGLNFTNVGEATLILAVISITLLILRSLLSILLTRRILIFLGDRSALISKKLLADFLNNPSAMIRQTNSQETIFAITRGVDYLFLRILGTFIVLVSDLFLLIVLFSMMLAVDAISAICTVILFGLVGFFLHKSMGNTAQKLGEKYAEETIAANIEIEATLASYRELAVRDRLGYQANKVGSIRKSTARILAELDFMPYISKYLIEGTLIVGTVTLAILQFQFNESQKATFTLTLFLSAGVRIAPSVLRFQQGLTLIRSTEGIAQQTLNLIVSSREVEELTPNLVNLGGNRDNLQFGVEVKDVSLRYNSRESFAIRNLSFSIEPGSTFGIVGPSGSGKTSTLDVILGITKPDSGEALVGGLPAMEVIKKFPGLISYVPQRVSLTQGSLLENVVMGYDVDTFPLKRVWECLELAGLGSFVESLPNGLYGQVGDYGSNLSGGQRQRIGIARAMLLKPKIIFLDEATNNLDSITEDSIVETINNLKSQSTIIWVTHRISTMRKLDRLVLLKDGEKIDEGQFDQLLDRNPNFFEL
jgi:ABC-type multidrug transport system fused ATPase/permease subunit